MSVYKEAVHGVKMIESASKRIYPDAADYGAPYKKGDAIWNMTKQLIDWYGVEGTLERNDYQVGASVSQNITFMPNEHVSGRYVTYKVTAVTTRDRKDMNGFVTVELIK